MSTITLNKYLKKHYNFSDFDVPENQVKYLDKFISKYNPGLQFIHNYGVYYYFVGIYRNTLILPKSKKIIRSIEDINGVNSEFGTPYSLGSPWRHSWGMTDFNEYTYDLPVLVHLILKNENGKFKVDTVKEQLFKNRVINLPIYKNYDIDFLEDPRIFVLNPKELGVYCHYRLNTIDVNNQDIKKMCKLRIKDPPCDETQQKNYSSTQKITMSVIKFDFSKQTISTLRKKLEKLDSYVNNKPFEVICNQFVGDKPDKNWAILKKPKNDYSIKFLPSIGYYGNPSIIQVFYNKKTDRHIFKPICNLIETGNTVETMIENNEIFVKTLQNKKSFNDPLQEITDRFKKLFPNILNGISVGGSMISVSKSEQMGVGHLKINFTLCKDNVTFPSIINIGNVLKNTKNRYNDNWGKDNEIVENIDHLDVKNNKPLLHSNLIYLTFFFKLNIKTFKITSITSPFFMMIKDEPISFLQFCHSITSSRKYYHIPYGRDDFNCDILNIPKTVLNKFITNNEITFQNPNKDFNNFFDHIYVIEGNKNTNKINIYNTKTEHFTQLLNTIR